MRIDVQNAILLLLCLVLLLSVFTLSASAADEIDILPRSSDSSSSLALGYNPYTYTYKARTTSSEDVYAFSYPSGSSITYCFASAVNGTNVTIDFWVPNASSPATSSSYSTNTYNSATQLYYYSVSYSNSTSYVHSYSSLSAGLVAVRDLIDNPPQPPVTPSPLEYTLPPGNVAYIPIPSGQSSAISYTLTTTYYMAFGNNDTSRINQVVTVMSALPSTTNNLAPSSPKIPWTNNGNVNLLGVSANKIYQGSVPANYGGQYLVVVNPMTMPSQSGLIGGDTYTNGSINIFVSAVVGSPYIYPMSESLTITPGDGIGSESSYGDSGYTYEIDPETGEIIWTDPDGGNSAPVAGGNNPMPSPNTIFDWLRNISQQFSDFLRGPVQAVQVVVSAIRDFMGSFTQLYQWLPSPVYSLITSALMIALTIGVIKIFV